MTSRAQRDDKGSHTEGTEDTEDGGDDGDHGSGRHSPVATHRGPGRRMPPDRGVREGGLREVPAANHLLTGPTPRSPVWTRNEHLLRPASPESLSTPAGAAPAGAEPERIP
jgi:hypothetical protein